MAEKTAEGLYEYREVSDYSDGLCHVTFEFLDGALYTRHPDFNDDCDFGARAHASFDLVKTSDSPGKIERY